MKTYFAVNLCICLAVLGGTVFVASRAEKTTKQLRSMEAGSKEEIRKLSNELSVALTRVGELEGRLRELGGRMEGLSAGRGAASGEDIEYQVRKILNEDRDRRRQGWERQMGRVGELNLKPEQREVGTKLLQDGIRDWMDLQAKIQAGEITREEARRLVGERWNRDLNRFRDALDEDQRKKLGAGGEPENAGDKPAGGPQEPAGKPGKADEPGGRGDEKPVPPAEQD